MEIWRGIPEYLGLYEVSNFGQVRSVARIVNNNGGVRVIRARVLVSRINKHRNNYRYVTLCDSGNKKNRYVHELVLTCFIGPRNVGMQGCHNDGDTSNNKLSNLRWDTAKGNAKDKDLHGTHLKGERSGTAKLSTQQILEIRNKALTTFHHVIAAEYNISRQQVDRIVNRKRWGHV